MSEQRQQEVDRVLRALRNAEPDPGMPARILSTLHQASALPGLPARQGRGVSQTTSARVRKWLCGAGLNSTAVPWLAVAALLLAAVGGTLVYHGAAHPGWANKAVRVTLEDSASLQVPSQKRETPPRRGDTQIGIPALRGGGSSSQAASGEPKSIGASGERVDFGRAWQRYKTASPGSADAHVSEAKPETFATVSGRDASFPPPPLPLTEQERLLLRLARHEPPQQLAQLSKPALDAAFQRDKDRVAEFFAVRPTLTDQNEDPANATPGGQ